MHDFVARVRSGEIDIVKHIEGVLDSCKKINRKYSYFNAISDELALSQAERAAKDPRGRLCGVALSVKDCICVRGVESTAGSKILDSYRPVFNATAVQRVIDEGGIIIGKTSQDEFGHGSFSTNVGIGKKVPKNPFDPERSCGGSSGGSAGIAQKAGFAHVSLGESTGGSITAPASFCGVAGLCPTYGRVSRWGLIDYANSLDKIGPIGKSVHDLALALGVIAGHDPKDSTSLMGPADSYEDWAEQGYRGKIAVIKECFRQGVDTDVRDAVWSAVKKLESQGIAYDEVSLPAVAKYSVPVYYLIAMSETSTNLARYCGMRYGRHDALGADFNDYFAKVRSAGFGRESKRRIILGTFARMAGYRDAYYLRAARLRTRIIAEYKRAFKKYGALASPAMPILPPKFSDIEKMTPLENYMMDVMTAGPNLAGLPHLSVNAGQRKGLPVGIQLVADHLNEKRLLQIGTGLEK